MKFLIIIISTFLFFFQATPVLADPAPQKAVSESFGEFDPLITNSTGDHSIQSVGDIIGRLLPYLLTGAGLILFAMLIIGGFEIMTSTSDAKKADAGKQRITTAIVGFVIIFAAYWIAQILEIIFGVKIL